MTNKQTLFDTLGTQGATLTTTNVPNASQVTGPAAGFNTAIFDSASAAHGPFGATFTTVSGGNSAGSLIRIPFTASNTQIAVKAVGTWPAARPAADTIIATARASAAVTLRFAVPSSTSSGMYMLDKNSTSTPLLTASQTTALLGTKFTISVVATGGSTTAGVIQIKIYNSSLTLLNTVSLSNANLDTNPFAAMDWGIVGNFVWSFGWDDIQMNDGGTSEIADYSPPANNPPTVTTGPSQTVSPGTLVSVTSTATDTDGSIASRLWTLSSNIPSGATAPSLTGSTTATVSFTPPAQGVYTLTFTATDDGGATSTPATVKIFATGTTIVPIGLTQTVGPWVTTTVSNVTDSSDSTYAESPAAPTSGETSVRYRLAPLVTPSVFPLTVREGLSVSGTTTALVRLIEVSTVRKTWTITPTTSPADYALTLTPTEIGTVTSWNEIDLEITYTGS